MSIIIRSESLTAREAWEFSDNLQLTLVPLVSCLAPFLGASITSSGTAASGSSAPSPCGTAFFLYFTS